MYISENCNWTPYGTDPELDKKVDSYDWHVRKAVAEQGYGLDILVNDKDWAVREAMTEQGYGLDILVNDDNWRVRAAVARQGYSLDILINDEDYHVREAVAKQGYGLNVLYYDKDTCGEVINYLRKHGYKSLDDWAKANPNKIHGTKDIELTDILKEFVYKVNDSNTLKVVETYVSIDAFFNDVLIKSGEPLFILTVDTKVKLITLEKDVKDNKQVYKFIVDINNDDGDDVIIRSIITSKDKFIQSIQSIINVLNEYPQFQKYASDLTECL